jgi:hypothetical protein
MNRYYDRLGPAIVTYNNKNVTALKIPRLCPLVLLVKVAESNVQRLEVKVTGNALLGVSSTWRSAAFGRNLC